MGAKGDPGPQGPDGRDAPTLAETLQAVLDGIVPRRAAILNVWCFKRCVAGDDPAYCDRDGDKWSRGTGTKLPTGEVLTAHHVVEGARACVLAGETHVEIGRTTAITQPVADRDLAVLKQITWIGEAASLPSFDVHKGETPALGELILMATYPGPFNEDLQMTFGHVTDTNVTPPYSDETDLLAGAWSCDAAATHGSSGGPVFNARGDLRGDRRGHPQRRAARLGSRSRSCCPSLPTFARVSQPRAHRGPGGGTCPRGSPSPGSAG